MNTLTSLSVSWQSKIWLPIEKEVTIENVLKMIQSGEFEAEIDKVRHLLRLGETDGFHMYKRSLPAVTFCGCFDEKRKTENLKKYNSLLVIDIDKLSADMVEETAELLHQDPYVFAFWLSPSGLGFKGLMTLDFSFPFKFETVPTVHKSAFHRVARYFSDKYQLTLDESGCDVTRSCFLSFDPGLVIKQQAKGFKIEPGDLLTSRQIPNPSSINYPEVKEDKRQMALKNNPVEMAEIECVIKYLKDTGQSITATYEQWYRVAYSLCEAFTYKIGLGYYLTLCSMDGGDFDIEASKRMFHYCFKNADGRIKLNSLFFYAVQAGYQSDLPIQK